MKLFQKVIEIETRGCGMTDVTSRLQSCLVEAGVHDGLCVVFVQHSSASLTIQENADPAVRRDLQQWMSELAPESRRWEHDDEGPDDMPAHAKSVLTSTSETIPIQSGRLALGTWQGLYLWEHRSQGHRRRLFVHIQGE